MKLRRFFILNIFPCPAGFKLPERFGLFYTVLNPFERMQISTSGESSA